MDWGNDMDWEMMEMDQAYACENAQMLLSEIQEYASSDESGMRQKEDEWSMAIGQSIKGMWEDMDMMGATSTTTFAAAVASVVALLSF